MLPEAVRPIRHMADGTVKQTNPYSGTSVWTVPGRANRPLAPSGPPPEPIDASRAHAYCAFCPTAIWSLGCGCARPTGSGGMRCPPRRSSPRPRMCGSCEPVPDLAYSYWQENYGMRLPPGSSTQRICRHWAGAPAPITAPMRSRAGWPRVTGRRSRRRPSSTGGMRSSARATTSFAAAQYVDGAEVTTDLAARARSPGGTLRVCPRDVGGGQGALRGQRLRRARRDLQNWLRPAGASFEHLHKQPSRSTGPG